MHQNTSYISKFKCFWFIGALSCWSIAILTLGHELAQWFNSQGDYPLYLLHNVGVNTQSLINPPNHANLMLTFSITLFPKILNSLVNAYLGIFFIELFMSHQCGVMCNRLMLHTGILSLMTVPCALLMEIGQTYLISLNLPDDHHGIEIYMQLKREYHTQLIIGLMCIIISRVKGSAK